MRKQFNFKSGNISKSIWGKILEKYFPATLPDTFGNISPFLAHANWRKYRHFHQGLEKIPFFGLLGLVSSPNQTLQTVKERAPQHSHFSRCLHRLKCIPISDSVAGQRTKLNAYICIYPSICLLSLIYSRHFTSTKPAA